MKPGWEQKPLGSVLSILNGYAFDAKAFVVESGKPLIRIRDLKNGVSTQTNFDGPFDCRYIVEAGSFLIGMDGEFGCYEWRGPDALLNQRVCKLHSFASEIDPRFLFYGINKHLKDIEDNTTYTTVKHLSSKQIANIDFAFPPIEEQRRIVAVLDKAFAGIATATMNAQQNLNNARALFDGYLRSTLFERDEGWSEYSFDEVCSISSKLVDPRLPAYLDLPHIGAGNMVSRTGDIIDVMTAREEGLKSGKFLFDRSMVLYSKIRPYLMKACRPNFSGLCSADVYPLVPNAGLLERDMLFHLLMSDEFTAYAESGSARAGMPKVNRDHLFKYAVWLPEVKTQRVICDKLDELALECQNLADVSQSKLGALFELKQSLLQKAFAGELT